MVGRFAAGAFCRGKLSMVTTRWRTMLSGTRYCMASLPSAAPSASLMAGSLSFNGGRGVCAADSGLGTGFSIPSGSGEAAGGGVGMAAGWASSALRLWR